MAKVKELSISREVTVLHNGVGDLAGGGSPVIIPSSSSLEERIGMRIHMLEYFAGYFDNTPADQSLITALAASADEIKFGLAFLASQPSGGFLETSPGVLDFNRVRRMDYGTAGSHQIWIDPIIRKDFSNWPGGGILCHPANVYHWSYCNNAMGASALIPIKIHYTLEDISDAEWEQLWKQIFVTQAG